MCPLPRSLAAEAISCFMVRTHHLGSTEYKVVARSSAPEAWLRSDCLVARLIPPPAGGLGMLRVKSRASARPLRGYGLDPSAFPVRVARQSVGVRRRRSAKARKDSPKCDIPLDKKHPIQGPSVRKCTVAYFPQCHGASTAADLTCAAARTESCPAMSAPHVASRIIAGNTAASSAEKSGIPPH
jgi:hypothetical protein